MLKYLLALLLLTPAYAHDYKLGSLHIHHPWTRATPESAKVAGGFLKITNNGAAADRLIGGSFMQATSVEVHEMKMNAGVMQMRSLPQGLEIPSLATIELKPGGFHLMFLGLKTQLKAGDKVFGTLIFERAGKVEVEFNIEAMGGTHHVH